MRIVLSTDMEGVSQIADPRETNAAFPEYWNTGRDRYTAEVAAAARGLIAGGASEVLVLDNHASGNPVNLLPEQLPHSVRLEQANVFDLSTVGVDAMFQLGYHPRAGVAGFISHTYSPGLRLRVGDELISESHGRAWAAMVPLIGIVGSDAHSSTLGSLSATPFLPVQLTETRTAVVPAFPDPVDGRDAIESFAATCARSFPDVAAPAPPGQTTLRARLKCAREDRMVLIGSGWRSVGADEFAVEIGTWREARDPLYGAMAAATGEFRRILDGVNLASPAAAEDEERLAGYRQLFLDWVSRDEEEW